MPRVGNTAPAFRRGMVTTKIGLSEVARPNLFAARHIAPANGWILGISVLAGTEDSSRDLMQARVALWGGLSYDPVGLRHQSELLSLSRAQAWRGALTNRRVERGLAVWVGIWAKNNVDAAGIVSCANSGVLYYYNESKRLAGGVPSPIAPDETFTGEAAPINSYFDYVANAAPTTGSVTSPAAGALVSSTTVTIAGTTPHAGGDGAYDHSAAIQLQVYDAATNLPVYDQILATTSSEQVADVFSRAVGGFEGGKSYYARFRHQDSWGVWSPYSANRTFSIAAVPDAPTPVSPRVKLDQRSGYEYRMVHNHSEGRPADTVEVELYNASGLTRLWTSGARTLVSQVAAGDTFGTAASGGAVAHPTLAWATGYSWRARVRDTLGSWSGWSPLSGGAFATNSTPTAPTGLVPKDGSRTGDREFRSGVTDPNGDAITAAQIELVRVSTGAVVTGYPRAMTLTGGTAVYTVPEADLAAGQLYRWRARATDGLASGYGPWSGYAQFTFAAAATVRLLTPSQTGRVNMIAEPSAEYGTAVSRRSKNLLTANQSDVETDLTGLQGHHRGTISRDTTEFWQGVASLKFDTNPNMNDGLTGGRNYAMVPQSSSPIVPANTNCVGSAYVKATAGQAIVIAARTYTPAGALISDRGSLSYVATGQWQRINTAVFTETQDCRVVLLFPFPDVAVIVYLDGMQVEVGSVVTDWIGEYTEGWWRVVNESAGNRIIREQTDDAAYGEWRWLAERADASVPAPYIQSPRLPVDQLERYLAQIHLKKLPLDETTTEIPALTSLLEVLCYNAAGALIGTVSPSSVGSANNTDPPPYWRRYGGPVWPSDETSAQRFPVGTTQARIRVTPVSGSTTGRVAVDALSFEVMPDATTGSFAGQHYSDSSFFGYADPDTDGYGGPSGEWLGDTGSSQSEVRAVLQDPATNHVMYSYSHPNALAINSTRVIVQRREDPASNRWRPHHDSGYRAPASTPTVTLPDYLFRNELRYRVKVICRDSQGIDGESEWVEFVARFEGPPEIPIFSYHADADRGTITVSFESTGLAPEEFGGIEVARSAEDEPMKVVAVIRDAGASSYTYHFPVSETQYRFYVRQVRLVGPEQIEGRWRTVEATVGYEGFNFLKHAHRPDEYVVFQHSSGLGPNQSRDAAGEGYVPWGSEVPVHLFSEARFRSDTTSFLLFPHHPQSSSERLRILKVWERQRPPLCLMAQQPAPEKVFVALLGSVRFSREGRLVRCELDWQQTAYQEPSPYDIEGAVEDLWAADLGLAT